MDINRVSSTELESARIARRVDSFDTDTNQTNHGRTAFGVDPEAGELNAPSPSAPSRVESTVLKKTNPTAVAGLAVHQKRKRHATHFTSGKWLPNLPLPPAYERLLNVFVATQQVGPLLRKRQQQCTADVVCASVETMTGKRCTLAMLRSVEAVMPGTINFSCRGGMDPRGGVGGDAGGAGRSIFENGPVSPRRVRADVAAHDANHAQTPTAEFEFDEKNHPRSPGQKLQTANLSGTGRPQHKQNDAKKPIGGVSSEQFRYALVQIVGRYHDVFCDSFAKTAGDDKQRRGLSTEKGSVGAWHVRFDLATVPDPPLEVSTVADEAGVVTAGGAVTGTAQPKPLGAEKPGPRARTAKSSILAGNGGAVPAKWHDGHSWDAADIKARSLKGITIDDQQASAAAKELGDLGSELPLAAVAAVMKRKLAVDHDLDPATIATRKHRRLHDLLPSTFDTVRSLFATSKRKVLAFSELLEQTIRASSRRSANPTETEQALRLVAEASPEWCALMPAHTTVSGEELFRVKTTDAAVTRFVRQKLVAMKEDKL